MDTYIRLARLVDAPAIQAIYAPVFFACMLNVRDGKECYDYFS